jgi:hypothetical protein
MCAAVRWPFQQRPQKNVRIEFWLENYVDVSSRTRLHRREPAKGGVLRIAHVLYLTQRVFIATVFDARLHAVYRGLI